MKKLLITCIIALITLNLSAKGIENLWKTSPAESRSWTFWYWMYGAVTRDAITADLEAMKSIGLEGAYLMPIRGVPESPLITPSVAQLTPQWWEMVGFAFAEADRLGMKIGFHVCDGFALAGGPWITPELSMQKVVWSSLNIKGGREFNDTLPTPESYKGYYKDISIVAYPTPEGEGVSTHTIKPKVSTNNGAEAQFLAEPYNQEVFRADDPCTIDYAFEQPFTCRSISVVQSGNNFQAQRLEVWTSSDGVNYTKVTQLLPPRQGWQNGGFAMTHSIVPTTSRYFRFKYDPEGTEPGAEDLDAAKWKANLRIKGIYLSSEARINQYEAKNGETWRVAPRTTAEQIDNKLCIDPKKIIDLTDKIDKSGRLKWKAPRGNWTILRMGHTSTGHTNATGGAGAGLECDKFNPEAVKLQFDSWFGKAAEVAGEDVASRVLKIFHVDSWECGSQNWSTVMRAEFLKRRGYDIYPYMPLFAGVPIGSAEQSERVLHDLRQTIAELVVDNFYATLKEEANRLGCQFSAESVAPTMVSDGMMHYKNSDIPMGEFWFKSPTHDKPNDVLDAISGGHIYGKNVIQTEAFTQLRTMFDEHPAMVKALQDRHYALGINRLSYHVNVLNPWLDRQPGMTLDGIGLYFQRDQTWWKPARAWVDYAQRCQALLQYGVPVVDIAVFTGEELPRRSILPDRLVPFLPGVFGAERVESEKNRLANEGNPTRQMPAGVTHSANITDASQWVNPLHGYAYDSFNPDALLNLAKVEGGRIVLPSGMSYSMLVIPGNHQMQPNPERISVEVADKLKDFAAQGATILIGELPNKGVGAMDDDAKINFSGANFVALPYSAETFDQLGVERDFIATEPTSRRYAKDVAYSHRRGDWVDIYFISNQSSSRRELDISLRATGRTPERWNPVSGEITTDFNWETERGRTYFSLTLDESESVFVVFQTPTAQLMNISTPAKLLKTTAIDSPWALDFEQGSGCPENLCILGELRSWDRWGDTAVKYYSGTATYRNSFEMVPEKGRRYYLTLDELYNLAEVRVNGRSCGIIWTKPYRLDITDAIVAGENSIEIDVTNTWANRLMGEQIEGADSLQGKKHWTNARYHLGNKTPVKSGLAGDVTIITLSK